MKTIMNPNMKNQTFRMKGDDGQMVDVSCDGDGKCDLPDAAADRLLSTQGWTTPVKRTPRKPAQRAGTPAPPPEPSEGDEGTPDGAEGGEGSGEEETEEVPPYSEWNYKDLVQEAKNRMEDPNFQPPDSKGKEDIIKALEADDARG